MNLLHRSRYRDVTAAFDILVVTSLYAGSLLISSIATYASVFFIVKTWKLILGA